MNPIYSLWSTLKRWWASATPQANDACLSIADLQANTDPSMAISVAQRMLSNQGVGISFVDGNRNPLNPNSHRLAIVCIPFDADHTAPGLRRAMWRWKKATKYRGYGDESTTWRNPGEVSAVISRLNQRRMERTTAQAMGASKRQGRL